MDEKVGRGARRRYKCCLAKCEGDDENEVGCAVDGIMIKGLLTGIARLLFLSSRKK